MSTLKSKVAIQIINYKGISMTYHDVMKQVGEFDKFQVRFCVLVLCSTFTCALGTLTMIYTLYTPPHRCFIPGIDGNNPLSNPEEALSFIPNITEDGTISPSKCKRFIYPDNNTITDNSTEINCDAGWKFDKEAKIITVITEFELVCGRALFKPLATSLFMVGEAIGSFIGGGLADRFGRRPLLVWGKMIEFLLYFLVGFSPNIYVFMVLMTISGAFVYLPYTTIFVLANEVVGTTHRNTVSLCVYGGYCTGAALVPLLGYLVPDWHWLMRVSGLIGLLYIPFYWIIPESPFWLLSSGKYEKAKVVLEKIAASNGRSWNAETLKETFLKEEEVIEEDQPFLKPVAPESDSNGGILPLLQSSIFRYRLLVAYISWIVTNMVYYGLALGVTALSGDRYWNAAISGLLEFPGILAGFLLIQLLGRPLSLTTLMGIGGVCLAIAAFFETANSIATTILVIFGKTNLIGAFYINFSITGEMSPTLYRNIAVGSSSAVGKVGSFVAPYLMFLGETTSRFVPFLVMGGLALISAILSLAVLPETKGASLPDTITDAEVLPTIFRKSKLRKYENEKVL